MDIVELYLTVYKYNDQQKVLFNKIWNLLKNV